MMGVTSPESLREALLLRSIDLILMPWQAM